MPDVLVRGEKGSPLKKDQEGSVEVVIPSDPAEGRRVQDDIEKALAAQHFDEHEIFSIKLALEEAIINAMKHGNGMDRNKKVTISYRVTLDRFDIHITDEGKGFDPDDVPDPMAVENLERPSGRGLLLMRYYMTEVDYVPPGNRVAMCKVRKGFERNGQTKTV